MIHYTLEFIGVYLRVAQFALRCRKLLMHLVQILLPLADNQGRPLARKHFTAIQRELTKRFSGLTAYSRSPAEGHWRPRKETKREEPKAKEKEEPSAEEPKKKRRWFGRK